MKDSSSGYFLVSPAKEPSNIIKNLIEDFCSQVETLESKHKQRIAHFRMVKVKHTILTVMFFQAQF